MGRMKYVEGVDFDKVEEVNRIAESIAKEWDIDEDIAIDIVGNEYHNMLDQFMFINTSGEVWPANNEQELKEQILDYLKEEDGCLTDIEYVFINGEKVDLALDIQFKKKDPNVSFDPKELEKMSNVPEPPTDDAEEISMFPGQEYAY